MVQISGNMLRRLVFIIAVVVALAAGAFWIATSPGFTSGEEIRGLAEGDARAGERIFWAGGCASCHAAPESKGENPLRLAGGLELKTPFGTFVAPNISPHKADGIGQWTADDLANAMRRGVSPGGRHYYPAFPYTSYIRMSDTDISDLHAFLMTLEPVQGKVPDHRLGFPYGFRRGIGLWKWVNLSPDPVLPRPTDELAAHGQYLVEGPGHCGECHTPRDAFGGLEPARWLSGAPAAEGEGRVPNITPGEGGIGSWSQNDIAYYFETGFTPEFDSVGGAMADVQRNLARLPARDREAIAAYLKAVPPLPDGGQ